MKLEVGMYVRTPKGIAKIEEITEDRTEIYFNCDTGLSISFFKKDFTREEMAKFYKHSYNIIELIEEGDYVNEYLVEDMTSVYDNGEEIITLHIASGSNYFQHNINDIKEIKSIVTKEQFESIKYSLEG